MVLKMESVRERDIDLWLASRFINDQIFTNWFVNRLDLCSCTVKSVLHSLADENGESDITVIVHSADHDIGLLIEDKIDAAAMPDQYARYIKRGEKGTRTGDYDSFHIIIVAPKEYLESNSEAQKYPCKISYEELKEHADPYGRFLLDEALKEKKTGYKIRPDEQVRIFWEHFYKYVDSNHPKLTPYIIKGPRGSHAVWPTFKTPVKGTRIQYKSDKGYVDLELSGYANRYHEFMLNNDRYLSSLDNYMKGRIKPANAGKSLALRINVPVIDLHKEFVSQINGIEEAMIAAEELQELLKWLVIEPQ